MGDTGDARNENHAHGSESRDGLSIVADVGVVAQSPTNFGNLGRAVFGNAGVENAWRDMRLSPMWQLGVRYAF